MKPALKAYQREWRFLHATSAKSITLASLPTTYLQVKALKFTHWKKFVKQKNIPHPWHPPGTSRCHGCVRCLWTRGRAGSDCLQSRRTCRQAGRASQAPKYNPACQQLALGFLPLAIQSDGTFGKGLHWGVHWSLQQHCQWHFHHRYHLGSVLLLCLLAPKNHGVPQERVGKNSAEVPVDKLPRKIGRQPCWP